MKLRGVKRTAELLCDCEKWLAVAECTRHSGNTIALALSVSPLSSLLAVIPCDISRLSNALVADHRRITTSLPVPEHTLHSVGPTAGAAPLRLNAVTTQISRCRSTRTIRTI